MKAPITEGGPDVEIVTKVEYIYEDTRATIGVEPDVKHWEGGWISVKPILQLFLTCHN